MNRLFFFLFIAVFLYACSTSSPVNEQKEQTAVEASASTLSIDNKATKTHPQSIAAQGTEKKASITKQPAPKIAKAPQNQMAANQSPTQKVLEAKRQESKAAATQNRLTATPQKATPTVSEEMPVTEEMPVEVDLKPTHSNWNQLLQTYVNSKGVVNYSNWKGNMTGLNDYITELGADAPDKSWSRSEKMAYWMNLYNAATIKLILDNFPVKSIMDINNSKPWDKKWIKVGANTYSLNQIENDIIRPRFDDGRIHFAINCAAKSCPPISNKAFTASNVDSSLTRLTKSFINNVAFNKISANQLELSNIFNWYAKDFGDVKTFIGQYTEVAINADAKVSFIEYDWALNGK